MSDVHERVELFSGLTILSVDFGMALPGHQINSASGSYASNVSDAYISFCLFLCCRK